MTHTRWQDYLFREDLLSLSFMFDRKFLLASWLLALFIFILSAIGFANQFSSIALALLLLGGATFALGRFIPDKTDRRFLLELFLLAVGARIVLALILPLVPSLIESDTRIYDQVSWSIVQSWRERGIGSVPDGGILPDSGFYYLNAAVYTLVGHQPFALGVLNSFLGAFLIVPIFILGRTLFENPRVARWGAILIAFWPSLIYWSSQTLKEAPILLLTATILLCLVRLSTTPNWKLGGITVLLIVGLATLRLVLFPVLFVLLFVAIFASLQNRFAAIHTISFLVVVTFLSLGAFGVMLASRYTPNRSFDLIPLIQLHNADAYGATALPLIDPSLPGLLTYLPLGLAYYVAAPFIWIPPTNIRQWIAACEILAWYIMMPLTFIGLRLGWEKLRGPIILILIYFGLMISVTFIIAANLGTLHRIRLLVWVFCFLFAASGAEWLIERIAAHRRPQSAV